MLVVYVLFKCLGRFLQVFKLVVQLLHVVLVIMQVVTSDCDYPCFTMVLVELLENILRFVKRVHNLLGVQFLVVINNFKNLLLLQLQMIECLCFLFIIKNTLYHSSSSVKVCRELLGLIIGHNNRRVPLRHVSHQVLRSYNVLLNLSFFDSPNSFQKVSLSNSQLIMGCFEQV